MNDIPRDQGGGSGQPLIGAAAAALAARAPSIPPDFLPKLFALAAAEDLERYGPAELAALAADAWGFLAQRSPGVPKLRLAPAPAEPGIFVLSILNDDMPFLVDSVMGELNERGLDISLLVHPVFAVTRDPSGRLTGFEQGDRGRESLIRIHVGGLPGAAALLSALEQVLGDVRVAVEDWAAMLARAGAAAADLRHHPPPLPDEDVAEAIEFLDWLTSDNFTFLGARDYTYTGGAVQPDFATGLGLLRSPGMRVLRRGDQLVADTPEIREFLDEQRVLIVAKAAMRSRVHRRVQLDYVGVKRFDGSGRPIGEHRFCGLFTSTAYTGSPRGIPYLRRKVDHIIRRAGFDPQSHSGKALVNVLETYPRDELFQIDEETLFRFALLILQLDQRPRVRVLPRRDRFDRFVAVLVYVPRERYDSRIRQQIGACLATAYKGRVRAFYPFFAEGPLVRVHFIIDRDAGGSPDPERKSLERAVEDIVRSWDDGLDEAIAAAKPGDSGLSARYRDAFPIDYREVYPPESAVADLRIVEALTPERPLGVEVYREVPEELAAAGLKVFSLARPIPLSARVPVLENMGFRVVDERTYHIRPRDAAEVFFHDMVLESAAGEPIDLAGRKSGIEACFLAVMGRAAENDGYNALVLAAGLAWRDVALLRAVSRFLRQIRVPYSQGYMWATLRKHAGIAKAIVALFYARFAPRRDPAAARAREAEVAAALESALGAVESLDEDRIVRHFINAVTAAVRTNFFQRDGDGRPRELIAIKFASRKVDGMPPPRPLYEVFVYSPRLEAAHLRFGKVARGGIRWSDRPQDFRTEILGLVKAQNVKNAVIVPVGAKGGFVPKYLSASPTRAAIAAEGVAAYKMFISSLLDITDNIGTGTAGVIAPPDVVRHDGDDPYLVVAADKGTATFSDIANELAVARDYWLGDAFASGGSTGYDHKRIGITARGAWESVKRHFREADIDIGARPFTVAGVGDMSGDVFGNGMLAERTIKLVAAFDHRDIFIDPDPDPQRSFAARRRLFDMPRSSWQDYERTALSEGGNVYSRSAKEIRLSPQAQALFGANAVLTPAELIRAILKAPVDLLYFGGIGTYVRAADEPDEAVGDRANDALRVAGRDLRCKVIGEGANLGMTQRGRIEAARHGIRLNTDAIDNSAGVNTSDMEVNIKIALSIPLRDGRISQSARNALLGEMTDEVAALVLRNNAQQTLSLSLAERRGMEDFGFLSRLIQTLEARGLIDRAVECLPDEAALTERRRRAVPFTRPELSVLLAYAKLALHDDLLESPVPDDPYLAREIARYFPRAIVERFPDALERHRLRREIIATQLGNSMINRGGPALTVRIADQTGAAPPAIAKAFAAVRDSYAMTALNTAIDELDNRVAGKVQLELYAAIKDLLLDRIVWFLRNVDLSAGLADVVSHYRDGIAAVAASLDRALTADGLRARAARQSELAGAGVPEALAGRLADLRPLTAAPDIVLVADRTGRPVGEVAAIYFAAAAFFRLDRIASAARAIAVDDYFDRLALDRARDAIGDAERRITAAMVKNGAQGADAVAAWVAPRRGEVERILLAMTEIVGSGLTLSKLAVAASLLGDLAKN